MHAPPNSLKLIENITHFKVNEYGKPLPLTLCVEAEMIFAAARPISYTDVSAVYFFNP
jgi:hypothetical protein